MNARPFVVRFTSVYTAHVIADSYELAVALAQREIRETPPHTSWIADEFTPQRCVRDGCHKRVRDHESDNYPYCSTECSEAIPPETHQ